MCEIHPLYEDDSLLVVSKPAGLGTQAPQQFDSLEARVRRYLTADIVPDDPSPYLGIPHRLDRCVSGVIVFAKRKKAAQRLSKQFERREVEKTYLALVAGRPDSPEGTWRDTMRKIPEEPRAELVSADHEDAKTAVLHYRVEQTQRLTTLLSIRLETGRMHQIRLQCSVRGYPILGDRLYGSELDFGPPVEHDRDRQIALHASSITVNHPRTREQMTFTAKTPSNWPSMTNSS